MLQRFAPVRRVSPLVMCRFYSTPNPTPTPTPTTEKDFTSKVAGALRNKVFAKDFESAQFSEKQKAIIDEWRNPSPARSKTPDDFEGASASADSVDVANKYGAMFRDQRPVDPNETLENKRRRLVYQSRYRGMVEMDLIFGHFARLRLEELDRPTLEEYDVLLKQLDNDLFRWLVMGQEAPQEIEQLKCFALLKEFIEKERHQLQGHIL